MLTTWDGLATKSLENSELRFPDFYRGPCSRT
jgi:hypothetical protein